MGFSSTVKNRRHQGGYVGFPWHHENETWCNTVMSPQPFQPGLARAPRARLQRRPLSNVHLVATDPLHVTWAAPSSPAEVSIIGSINVKTKCAMNTPLMAGNPAGDLRSRAAWLPAPSANCVSLLNHAVLTRTSARAKPAWDIGKPNLWRRQPALSGGKTGGPLRDHLRHRSIEWSKDRLLPQCRPSARRERPTDQAVGRRCDDSATAGTWGMMHEAGLNFLAVLHATGQDEGLRRNGHALLVENRFGIGGKTAEGVGSAYPINLPMRNPRGQPETLAVR
jgi:hypothetical protein